MSYIIMNHNLFIFHEQIYVHLRKMRMCQIRLLNNMSVHPILDNCHNIRNNNMINKTGIISVKCTKHNIIFIAVARLQLVFICATGFRSRYNFNY